MDSNDKLTGAILVPDKDCYGCYFGGHTERIIEGLEKTLQEKDLRNKQVFLVGNGQYSKGQSVCDTSYEVKQMFESRGAKVFPTEEEINPNK